MLVFSVLTATVYLYSVCGQLDQYSADAGAGGLTGAWRSTSLGCPGRTILSTPMFPTLASPAMAWWREVTTLTPMLSARPFISAPTTVMEVC